MLANQINWYKQLTNNGLLRGFPRYYPVCDRGTRVHSDQTVKLNNDSSLAETKTAPRGLPLSHAGTEG